MCHKVGAMWRCDMKKALKELIENAEPYNGQAVCDFLIIPSGKKYQGFWGKNGYNKIIILGRSYAENKVFRIDTAYEHDVIDFYRLKDATHGQIDIPQEYNCIRLHFGKYVKVNNAVSSLLIEEV